MMKKTLLLIAIVSCAIGSASAQILLAGYDFTNGTAAAASPNAPNVYVSAFGTEVGTASLFLDGEHGASTFVTAATGNEVTAFGGTTVNAGAGFSPSTASPSALALQGGAATPTANGKMAVFSLSTTGYQGFVLTFATQRTSTGFTGNTFSYSLDGTTFTPAGITITPATSFATATADFSSIPALSNVATVYIGYTLAGATTATGNNRLDNIQFTSVPEPAAVAYILAGLGIMAIMYRKRLA